MKYDHSKYHRQSIRLKGYDYRQNGYYFITICSHNREKIFGEIRRGTIFCALNEGGKIAKKFWEEIPQHYPFVGLDEYVIMPDHVHGIIIIKNKRVQDIEPLRQREQRRVQNRVQDIEPLRGQFQKNPSGSLGSIIRGYKISVTKWYRKNTNIQVVWQRNFYEHIIRNDEDLYNIREYIRHNPVKWAEDIDNPMNNY